MENVVIKMMCPTYNIQMVGSQRVIFVIKGMPFPVTLAVFQNFFFLNYG